MRIAQWMLAEYLRGEFRKMSNLYVMNNNFAFGGVNTSLIFRRWS